MPALFMALNSKIKKAIIECSKNTPFETELYSLTNADDVSALTLLRALYDFLSPSTTQRTTDAVLRFNQVTWLGMQRIG